MGNIKQEEEAAGRWRKTNLFKLLFIFLRGINAQSRQTLARLLFLDGDCLLATALASLPATLPGHREAPVPPFLQLSGNF